MKVRLVLFTKTYGRGQSCGLVYITRRDTCTVVLVAYVRLTSVRTENSQSRS